VYALLPEIASVEEQGAADKQENFCGSCWMDQGNVLTL
jgi:hypothetical protein